MFGQDKDANGNKMFIPVSAVGSTYVYLGRSILVNVATLSNVDLPTDPLMPDLEDNADLQNTEIFSGAYDDKVEDVEADFNNLELTTIVSPIRITRIHKDHPKEQIVGDPLSALQTRRMTKTYQEHAMVTYIKKQRRTNHKDYQNFLLAYFLSQIEPKKVIQALTDPRWIEAMQDELLQFKLQKMDVKSVFLYGTIEDEVYVCQHPSFEDPHLPNKVYKVEKAYMVFIKLIEPVKTAITSIETNKALLKDEEAKDVDVHLYRSMIGSLMYLTSSRPDIMFAVCASNIVANSTIEVEYVAAANFCGQDSAKVKTVNEDVQIRALVDGKNVIVTEASIRCDLQLQDAEGTACLPSDTIFEELARMESLGDQEDASKQRRMIDNIDQDVEITLVDETQGGMNEEEMFGVNDLDGDEVIVDATTSEEVEQSTKVSKKEVSTV
nr:hypothetical protein [Tanacetum cinerariifolium]